jgi:hypothetical protein
MFCIILNALVGIAASAWFDFTGATALALLYISIGRSDIAAEMVAYFWLCTTYIQSSVLTLISPEPALKNRVGSWNLSSRKLFVPFYLCDCENLKGR